MSQVLEFSFTAGVGAHICGNCKKKYEDHGPGKKCLYQPTTYRQATDKELVAMIEALEPTGE